MSAALAVTKSTFDKEVLKSDIPVLVDFWASWCGPCRAIAPTLDEIAKEFDGKARIVKVDVDEEGDLAMEYNIMSIPALLFFKNGKVVDQVIGVQPKAVIASKLSALTG
jgi:thioredoxin 1